MNALWNVSVTDKGEKWIDLRVDFIHPNAGAFPEDRAFVLSLLTSEAYDYCHYCKPLCSLAREIPFAQSYHPQDLQQYVDRFISKTIIYETQNLPWNEQVTRDKIDKLCYAQGLTKDHPDWIPYWQDHWIDFWDNYNNLPWAKYRIFVTNSQWIEHLNIGQVYETASYSNKGPWVEENRPKELGHVCVTHPRCDPEQNTFVYAK